MAPTHADDHVHREVHDLLARSTAFRQLPSEEQARMAAAMQQIGDFLTKDPTWLDRNTPVRARALAEEEKKDPVTATQDRLAQKPGQVGAEFVAGAAREGVDQLSRLVNQVDFPAFVAGLVKGVFNAVVDASIQQMKAYGEMLAATVKTLDQFANDHVSEAQARDYALNKYPAALTLDTPNDGPARLRRKEGGADIDVGKEFGLPEGTDVDDEEGERALVAAARRDMARNNQQLLCTMVLLGINRIVVTDGKINAKVLFDVKTTDTADRKSRAEMHDSKRQNNSSDSGGFVVAPWGASGGRSSSSSSHTTAVSSAIDDTSSSKAELKASLSGDVHLAFKSETFPLERMLDAGQMTTLNANAQPGAAPSARPAATATPPATPPPGAAK